MSKPNRIVMMPTMYREMFGFCLIKKRYSKFMIANTFKDWKECPNELLEMVTKEYNQSINENKGE